MKVKTFRGSSPQKVMNQIKSTLGEDAVILSTQQYKEGNVNVCEVMAATEPGQNGGAPPKEHVGENPSGWSDWSRELSQFKAQILNVIRPQLNLQRLSPRQRLIIEYLEREGVNGEIIFELFERLKDKPDVSSLAELSKFVYVKGWDSAHWSEKCHALIGPHGVGKTSTILRLALRYKQKHPQHRVCMVNADLQQGKGRLFLKHYAELSEFEYREAAGFSDWTKLYSELDNFDLVLIDVPGLGGNKDLQQWLTENNLQQLKQFCLHLVLSPLYSYQQLKQYINKFHADGLKSLIWTKLDEACAYGSIINVGYLTGLPVSLLSCGPKLKNSLLKAEERALWRIILRHQLPR